MLQRKQSIYLFIAALLNAGVLYFDLYRTHTLVNGTDTPGQLRVADHYPSLLIALVMILLPLVTIFMFGNRKRQLRLSFVSIFSVLSFTVLMLARITILSKLATPPTSGSYWIGAVLPVISLVFVVLAIMGIRSDEKLVKSVDRLR